MRCAATRISFALDRAMLDASKSIKSEALKSEPGFGPFDRLRFYAYNCLCSANLITA